MINDLRKKIRGKYLSRNANVLLKFYSLSNSNKGEKSIREAGY